MFKPTLKQGIWAGVLAILGIAEFMAHRSAKKPAPQERIPVGKKRGKALSKTAKNKNEKRARKEARKAGDLAYGVSMAAAGRNNKDTRNRAKEVQRTAYKNALTNARTRFQHKKN